jgi:hypothetical protein
MRQAKNDRPLAFAQAWSGVALLWCAVAALMIIVNVSASVKEMTPARLPLQPHWPE